MTASATSSMAAGRGVAAERPARRSVAMLVMASALAVEAAIAVFVIVGGGPFPPLAAFASAFSLVFFTILVRPGAWAYLIGGLLLLLFVAMNIPFVAEDPLKPAAHPGTWAGIVTLALGPVAGICGIVAFRQARAGTWKPAAMGSRSELGAMALAGFLVGAGYVAAAAYAEVDASSGHGVRNDVLLVPTQPSAVLAAHNTAFTSGTVNQKQGPSVIYVTNQDSDFHTFDIDLDGRHYSYPLAAKSTTAVLLDLKSAGSHTFWCAVSGHRSRGMRGTLQVAPR